MSLAPLPKREKNCKAAMDHQVPGPSLLVHIPHSPVRFAGEIPLLPPGGLKRPNSRSFPAHLVLYSKAPCAHENPESLSVDRWRFPGIIPLATRLIPFPRPNGFAAPANINSLAIKKRDSQIHSLRGWRELHLWPSPDPENLSPPIPAYSPPDPKTP